MPKFQPIVISLLVAYVSATGCYPAYSPGNVASYAAGTSVSQVVTVTTPITWTACEVSTICITGWEQTGGITTTSAHNFVCSSDVWCSNVGYAPGGEHTDLAWTKEDAECSVSFSAHFHLEYIKRFLTRLILRHLSTCRVLPLSRLLPRLLRWLLLSLPRPRFGPALVARRHSSSAPQ